MAIKAKLDEAWNEKVENELLFEFRAVVQELQYAVDNAISEIDRIASSDNFSSVDAELKTEGIAIRTHINDFDTELDAHSDFINWVQP